jgi:hypothetical protein
MKQLLDNSSLKNSLHQALVICGAMKSRHKVYLVVLWHLVCHYQAVAIIQEPREWLWMSMERHQLVETLGFKYNII